mmetsp:Transcript_71378/g.185325  ORF Transcript_71378/g.185325 Transcript_71378/m.185325 type:complete len:540 (-) Transcript_71378:105-1724(-)
MAAERGGAAFEQLLRQLHEQHRKEVAELHQAIWELRQIAVKGGDPRPGPQTPRGDDDDLASFRDSHADRATLDGLPTDKPANDSGRESIGQDNTGHLVCIDGLTTETELPIQTQDENAALPSEEKRAAPEHAHSFRGPGVGAASKRIMMADTIIGCVIMLNIVFIFVRLDYQGYVTSLEMGEGDPGLWQNWGLFLEVMQHIFCLIFVIELIGRLIVFRCSYFYTDRLQKFNTFDAAIVVFTCVDLYIIAPFFSKGNGSDLTVIRALRFVRLLRAMRVVRTFEIFSKLRVLLSTVAASFYALLWSLVLLFVTMLMAALILTQIINPYLTDASIDDGIRKWMFKHYGTAGRSLWTVFEMTFSGGWPLYCRVLVEEVSVGFAYFFGVYVTTVVFAMTRIITALFLKDTLAVAANDADMMIREKAREKKAYAAKLLEFFHAADTSGDGKITFLEFEEFLADPRVVTYLATLELDASETENLFSMLDDGDGSVTAEEFVEGAVRLKGVARSQDVVAMMHDSTRLHKKIDRMHASLLDLTKAHQV